MLNMTPTTAFMADFNAICVKHKVPLKMWDDGDVTVTDWNVWKSGISNRLH